MGMKSSPLLAMQIIDNGESYVDAIYGHACYPALAYKQQAQMEDRILKVEYCEALVEELTLDDWRWLFENDTVKFVRFSLMLRIGVAFFQVYYTGWQGISLNKLPLSYLQVGMKVQSKATGNFGEIAFMDKDYSHNCRIGLIEVHWNNGKKSCGYHGDDDHGYYWDNVVLL